MSQQDSFYIVKRTFFDPKNPAEPTFNVTLPATFTDLRAAKAEAKSLPSKEGYDIDLFIQYDVKDDAPDWKYGDGVIVYAKGPSGEVFKVEIDTVPNSLGLEADASGKIQEPLFHVLQTIIDYNDDRSGSERYSIVEGTYATRERAHGQALRVLLDADTAKKDFVEYDEYADGSEGPFGADVIVHAVKEGGQNVLVSVVADH
ncbi:hypothetical protein CC80DRAFT_495356 [Byssothecium circinans]|uniref:Uncharacterized protein n=1 Tax=Byssothecium circinans TaxID=147558 RepID=A0A6A5TUI5_9PLEO|nr:hypothetical protein CC80DRAFT_495356 [Byssothecium circinans]